MLADVIEIKDSEAFWINEQDPITNSLTAISEGMGYFIKMNVTRDLTVTGPETKTGLPTMKTGWNLIGCPYQTATPLSTLFTPTNASAVKNFEGFWMPNGSVNSIQNLEPGKGYFLKKP